MNPPLVFEVMGGWWWLLEDKTNPLPAFEATEGVVVVVGQDEPPTCV